MFGTDTGSLNLYLDNQYSEVFSKYNRSLIWKTSGSKGKKWIQGRKTIKAETDFKIVFEAVTGKSNGLATIGNNF
jgi:hypothetical protein